MNITIVGTGAMATLFAARLSSVANISMIGSWQDAIDTIRRDGISIEHDGHYSGIHTATDPLDAPAADLAIVLVKTYKTDVAAPIATKSLKPNGIALTLQNGLGNVEILAQHVGIDRAMLGVTMQGATLLGPGHIRTSGRGATHLGYMQIERAAPSDFSMDAHAYEITALLNAAGLPAHVSADIDGLVWGKVIVNAGINALTAILRIPNGKLLESPDTLELMRLISNEAHAVTKAKNIVLPYPDPFERVKQVATLTASNFSSMLQDVMGKRPTEIDAINGKIVEYGRALNISTPINAVMTSLIRAISSHYTAADAESAEHTLRETMRTLRR